MLYLIWFFLVGCIVVFIADMMLEEWAGMDIVEAGALAIKRFTKTKGGAKKAAPAKSSGKAAGKAAAKSRKR